MYLDTLCSSYDMHLDLDVQLQARKWIGKSLASVRHGRVIISRPGRCGEFSRWTAKTVQTTET